MHRILVSGFNFLLKKQVVNNIEYHNFNVLKYMYIACTITPFLAKTNFFYQG